MMQSLHFDLNGMICGGCRVRVEHILGKLVGVSKFEVTLHPPFASVEIDPLRVTQARVVAAIARVGFVATEVMVDPHP